MLTQEEKEALSNPLRKLNVSLTPYYASLIDPENPDDPLRRTMIPSSSEFKIDKSEYLDPLAEDSHSPVPGIVHRYPDRVLFLITDFCPVYCRYCTRSRFVGGKAGFDINLEQWRQAIDYIAQTPTIRDVLISGGDPLIYSVSKLEWLLQRLRKIAHLEMIRIGTKVPFVLPQRITPRLTEMLKNYHPLYMSLHVIHPNEITPDASDACVRLANSGIPLGSQTVLLRGINDSVHTIRNLMHKLLKVRVKPYYLLQCDPVHGTAHFRTPIATGIEIIKGLRGHTSGYAVPHFIVDLPEGGGKISLDPEYITGKNGHEILLSNYQGRQGFKYVDPGLV